MQHPAYDKLIQFASAGSHTSELALARSEYVALTGDLFESDPDFENRIAAFLEWYTLDRPVTHALNATPARLYIDHRRPGLTTPEVQALHSLTRTRVSLLDIKRIGSEQILVKDLLLNEKLELQISSSIVGTEPGDVMEGRVFPEDGKLYLSCNFAVFPRGVRKDILKYAKGFRRNAGGITPLQMVQKCTYLRNRSTRYAHVDARQIFRELGD